MGFNLSYKSFGEQAVLIEWPSKIEATTLKDILEFKDKIKNKIEIRDAIIGYCSLTIVFKDRVNCFSTKIDSLKEIYTYPTVNRIEDNYVWEIPVCYHQNFGIDLQEISKTTQIPIDEIIKLHTEPDYLIYFLGFQPGFLYLGGLNSKIHIPRKATPRLKVEKGAVGIGGKQTGIYPQDSSGGWNIIGKSPLLFFDITKQQPCFAKAGDRIQFKPIDLDTFYTIEAAVKKGLFQPKHRQL